MGHCCSSSSKKGRKDNKIHHKSDIQSGKFRVSDLLTRSDVKSVVNNFRSRIALEKVFVHDVVNGIIKPGYWY